MKNEDQRTDEEITNRMDEPLGTVIPLEGNEEKTFCRVCRKYGHYELDCPELFTAA